MSIAPIPPNKSPVVPRPPKQSNLWLILLTIFQCITLGLVAFLTVSLNWHPFPSPTPTISATPTNTVSPEPATETPMTPIAASSETATPTSTATPTLTITPTTPACVLSNYPDAILITADPKVEQEESTQPSDTKKFTIIYTLKNTGGCPLVLDKQSIQRGKNGGADINGAADENKNAMIQFSNSSPVPIDNFEWAPGQEITLTTFHVIPQASPLMRLLKFKVVDAGKENFILITPIDGIQLPK